MNYGMLQKLHERLAHEHGLEVLKTSLMFLDNGLQLVRYDITGIVGSYCHAHYPPDEVARLLEEVAESRKAA